MDGIFPENYGFQSALMSIIMAVSAYFLVYNPNFFGTVSLSVLCLIVSPFGGYLLEQHADRVFDYLGNRTSLAMTDLLSNTASNMIGNEIDVTTTRGFVINVSQTAIDGAIDHLEMSQDTWVDMGKLLLIESADKLLQFETISSTWVNFTANAIQEIFGYDIFELFRDKSAEATTGDVVTVQTATNMAVMALGVFENTSVRESLVSGTRNAVNNIVEDNSFVGEVINTVTEISSGFSDLLSVSSASTRIDPIKVENTLAGEEL